VLAALEVAIKSVTSEWKAAKRQADRQDRVQSQQLERLRKANRRYQWTIKDATFDVMEQAYLRASANGTLPANARQIMYAARPNVIELAGECWKKSSYFTQHLLPDFMEERPELVARWTVVFDARGHLREPHTDESVDLGTLEVRRYIAGWQENFSEDLTGLNLEKAVPTLGPRNRYSFVLFIEKEGFNPLLESINLADRYDLAIMSTKGMSVTAARSLVERLSRDGVTILVLHDFDKAGFSIVNTLQTDTRRYQFTRSPKVVDIGLRLEDVETMQLQSEVVEYDGSLDPRFNLRSSGATEAECNFLVAYRYQGRGWYGQRVELNAMTSEQLQQWLEAKLEEVGVLKIVPDEAILAKAWRRAKGIAAVQKALDEAVNRYTGSNVSIPEKLTAKVAAEMDTNPLLSWDQALWELAWNETA
jgi:hypothetical protein